jgi:hypothetical protein
MSYLIAAPEMMTSAAADLATIGSNVSAAHMVAAARTVAVVPAAADEVSASIAHMFSQHAASYQALAGQAAAFQEQLVQHLTAGVFSYAATEAVNAALVQPLAVSAASIGGVIATLQGEILNLLNSVNAALGQLVNSLGQLISPSLIYNTIAFFVTIVIPVGLLALNVLLGVLG